MKALDAALAVLVMACWGLAFPIGKAGMAQIPPILMMSLRFALVAAILVWFVEIPRRRLGQILLLSMTLGTLHFSLLFTGIHGLDASTAVITIQLQVPIGALLAALIDKDRLGWRRFGGMALAFTGVALIAGEPRVSANIGFFFLVLGAALVWACANFQIRRLGPINGFSLNAWIAVFAAPQLLAASLLLEGGQMQALATADWRGYGAAAYIAVMGSVVGYGLWYHLVRKYEINQVVPFTLLIPFFGVLGGAALLGEDITWRMMAGGLATVSGVSIIVLRRPQIAAPEPREASGP